MDIYNHVLYQYGSYHNFQRDCITSDLSYRVVPPTWGLFLRHMAFRDKAWLMLCPNCTSDGRITGNPLPPTPFQWCIWDIFVDCMFLKPHMLPWWACCAEVRGRSGIVFLPQFFSLALIANAMWKTTNATLWMPVYGDDVKYTLLLHTPVSVQFFHLD